MSQMDIELIRFIQQERLARAERARRDASLPPELTCRPVLGSAVRGWLSRHTRRGPSQGWEAF